MVGMEKMRKFVHDHVFDAGNGTGGEPFVKGENPRFRAAASPAGRHPAKPKLGIGDAACGKERVYRLADLGHGFFAPLIGIFFKRPFFKLKIVGICHGEREGRSVLRGAVFCALQKMQGQALPEKREALSLLIPRGRGHLFSFLFKTVERTQDNAGFFEQKFLDFFFRHAPACRNGNRAVRADSEVDVFHLFPLQFITNFPAAQNDRARHTAPPFFCFGVMISQTACPVNRDFVGLHKTDFR